MRQPSRANRPFLLNKFSPSDTEMLQKIHDFEMGRYLETWNTFLTIFGLNCVEKKHDRYQVAQWKFTIPIVIIFSLCLLAYFLGARMTSSRDEHGQTKVSEYLNITGNLIAAAIIFSATISSNGYAYVKFRFILFDDMITINFRTLTKSIVKYSTFLLTIYAFSFITDFLVYQEDSSTEAALKIISSYVFQFYNLLTILNFSICLFWLRKSFALINRDLENQTQLLGAWSTKHNAHKLFNLNIVEPFDFLRLNKTNDAVGDVDRVRFLRSLYHAAYELSRDVNAVFSTRNVLSVGYNFLLGTIFMYLAISEVVNRANGKTTATTLELLVHFKWTFISFLSIYGLVWPCTSTCNEAKRTICIVQGLLTKSLNNDVRDELQSTSFQFIHEQVSFSPHGFFSLNNNLLLSITGAVVSYLVVLIQFRISMT